MPGLRYRRERGDICLYRPGMPASILLTGFNPRWWDRVVNRLAPDYDLLAAQAGVDSRGTRRLRRSHRLALRSTLDLLTPAPPHPGDRRARPDQRH